MNSYRIFLLRQQKIIAHYEFSAENDYWVCRAAALAFDACTDHCDDFELWEGVQLIATRAGLKTRAPVAKADEAALQDKAYAEALEEAIRALAVRILEAAMATSDVLRDSPRLNARLNALRRPAVGLQ